MKLLKELTTLLEAKDTLEDSKPSINSIASALFGKKAGPVVDPKRSKEAKFWGVADEKSKLISAKGKPIRLTFDNSTDSGEFELNSLTPLNIVKDGELDVEIKKLYKRNKVHSKKKTNYIDIEGTLVLRELHLGAAPDDRTVKLVKDFMKLVNGEKLEDEEEPKKQEPKKQEPKQDK